MNILGYETLRLLILTSAVFSFCAKMYIPEKDVVTFWKTGGKFVLFLRRFAYYNSKLRNEKCPPYVYPENLEESLTLLGETATVKVGGKSVNEILEWKAADGLDDSDDVKKTFSETLPNIYGYGHTSLYADMIDAITNGRQPLVNGEAGKRAMELILAIYQSAARGLPVKLPLLSGKTLDFKGRFQNE